MAMIVCCMCKAEKNEEEFKSRHRGDYRCRECNTKRHRKWAQENRKRYGPFAPAGVLKKRCWKCKKTRAHSAFGLCRSYPDGLNPQCKDCANEYARRRPREKVNAQTKKWHLRNKYGLSIEQHAAIFDSQNGKCALCGADIARKPCVDHCHKTGRVRGMLCSRCNLFMVVVDESGFLEKAQRYLASVDARMGNL